MKTADLDPWKSLALRAQALSLVQEVLHLRWDNRHEPPSPEATRFWAELEAEGMDVELSLRLKAIEDEAPWLARRGVPEGSRLHYFYTALHAVYSPWLEGSLERLKGGDSTGVEAALVFLEVDPWCFRSGYLKQSIARYLRHVDLDRSQLNRVQDAIIHSVKVGPRREFPEFVKLAAKVDSPGLRDRLRSIQRDDDEDEGTKERAGRILERLDRS